LISLDASQEVTHLNLFQTKRGRGVLLGVTLALLSALILSLLDQPKALDLTSMLLIFIAAPYIGFALMDGRQREIWIEIIAIIVFATLAILGLWMQPIWLVIGLFLHGIWDVIHHPHGIQTQLTSWYPPFCMVYDWLVAGYVLARFIVL